MVSDIFGLVIAGQVQDLTRIKFDGTKITAAETLLLAHTQNKMDIVHIKLFDRLHNMRTISAKSPEKARKIVEETLLYFVPAAKSLCLIDIANELAKLSLQALEAPEGQIIISPY